MANKLFQETQNNNLMNRVQEIKNNPLQFLISNRANVPPEYQNSPKDIVNYLVQSGQISQERFNQVMAMANQMGLKL